MTLEKFHFITSNDEEIVTPYLDDAVSYKAAKKIRKKYMDESGDIKDEEGLQEEFMQAAMDKATLEKVEALSLRDFKRFVQDWGAEDADKDRPSMGES